MSKRLNIALELLESIWGYTRFNPGQAQALKSWTEGKDVITLLPTGGGKSLCFQLPAMVESKISGKSTIVVSPLIALMQDQVDGLCAKGIKAASLHSQLTSHEQRDIETAFEAGLIDLLYISPERSTNPRFRSLVQKSNVGFLAIDEAHCVSQWGHDFRPDYLFINELKSLIDAPVMAVTATATPRVVLEIEKHLRLKTPTIIRGDFTRDNLEFSVKHLRSQKERIAAIEKALRADGFGDRSANQRAIVYCSTRKHTESITKVLRGKGFTAAYYHGGRSASERQKIQRAFDLSRIKVLVATNAFGMGVDYPNIRLLIHAQSPGSLEAYYQEAGRASRDGEPGKCLLFFSLGDMMTQRRLGSSSSNNSRLESSIGSMTQYAHSTICRQRVLVEHFLGEQTDICCGRCDICKGEANQEFEETARLIVQNAEDETAIINVLAKCKRPVGKSSLIKALRGSQAKTLKKFGLLDIPDNGILRKKDVKDIAAQIECLMEQKKIVRKGVKYPTLWLPNKPVRTRRATPANVDSTTRKRSTKAIKTNLKRALELYRNRTAKKLSWKPYMVLQKKVITALDEERPKTLDQLNEIHGLGPAKIERFGFDILKIVKNYDQPQS